MTVHVNEIIIRATVNEDGEKHAGKKNAAPKDAANKEGIVTECVEQVLEILKKEIKR
jgi:hypothetical protein